MTVSRFPFFRLLVITGAIFAVGVALFIYDFFRHAPTFDESPQRAPRPAPA